MRRGAWTGGVAGLAVVALAGVAAPAGAHRLDPGAAAGFWTPARVAQALARPGGPGGAAGRRLRPSRQRAGTSLRVAEPTAPGNRTNGRIFGYQPGARSGRPWGHCKWRHSPAGAKGRAGGRGESARAWVRVDGEASLGRLLPSPGGERGQFPLGVDPAQEQGRAGRLPQRGGTLGLEVDLPALAGQDEVIEAEKAVGHDLKAGPAGDQLSEDRADALAAVDRSGVAGEEAGPA